MMMMVMPPPQPLVPDFNVITSERHNDPHRRIVPRTKFADQGLLLLHKADGSAVTWLEDVATKAFAN